MQRLHLDSESFLRVKRVAHRQANRGGFEVCGAIIQNVSGVLILRPLENLATQPAKWEIKREWLRTIRRELRQNGSRLVGTYHSHVGGYAYPGEKDLDGYPSGFLLMIYDTFDRRVGLWRPLIRGDRGRLRSIAVTCDRPKWTEEQADVYATYLRGKFRAGERRNS